MEDDSEFLISCSCLSDSAGHPYFFNQLSQGLDILSMAGEWLAATANANMFTYEIAPVFIMMEHTVLLKMREVIGKMSRPVKIMLQCFLVSSSSWPLAERTFTTSICFSRPKRGADGRLDTSLMVCMTTSVKGTVIVKSIQMSIILIYEVTCRLWESPRNLQIKIIL